MKNDDNILNLETLHELREMLDDGLDEVLTEYVGDASQQLRQLHVAVEVGDVEAIGDISHSLKGSSGNLGIQGLYELCARLEQEAKSGTVGDAPASLALIEQEFDRAKNAINHFMSV